MLKLRLKNKIIYCENENLTTIGDLSKIDEPINCIYYLDSKVESPNIFCHPDFYFDLNGKFYNMDLKLPLDKLITYFGKNGISYGGGSLFYYDGKSVGIPKKFELKFYKIENDIIYFILKLNEDNIILELNFKNLEGNLHYTELENFTDKVSKLIETKNPIYLNFISYKDFDDLLNNNEFVTFYNSKKQKIFFVYCGYLKIYHDEPRGRYHIEFFNPKSKNFIKELVEIFKGYDIWFNGDIVKYLNDNFSN